MNSSILEMRNISKEFPGVKALDNVSFTVAKGEIHCLVGENGAGKSTLMKVLSGVYPHGSYNGDILFNGEVQQFRHISDSERVGIAIIYQELALVPEMTVFENIFLGHEIKRNNIVDWNETIKQAGEMLKKVNLDINPAVKVKELGIGKQQLVEIAKALSKDVKLLILDEPTSSLNEKDSENLLQLLRDLKSHGVTSIMISHKLKEVIAIADSITVLRDGKTICTLSAQAGEISEGVLIKNMVGREINNIYPPRKHVPTQDVILEVKNWNARNPATGRDILKDVNIRVNRGEIVGLAGLIGSGRTEFALSIFGNPGKYQIHGNLYLDGSQRSFNHPEEAIRSGLSYVSEDRKGNGLILIQDVKQNISLANLKELTKSLVVDSNAEIMVANKYKTDLNIKTPTIEQKVSNLSGGNQQKVCLGKWLFVKPNILILDEPTRGIDVGAKYEIYTIMRDL
ncbi:MAG TPA: sugar ABC transporter ATP-binding protein, partial [Anaerolineales bacterium]|nr:sugar ABC transporter ATP-binding protein [Anaerolineales bacterium]